MQPPIHRRERRTQESNPEAGKLKKKRQREGEFGGEIKEKRKSFLGEYMYFLKTLGHIGSTHPGRQLLRKELNR